MTRNHITPKPGARPDHIDCACGWSRVVLDWETPAEARAKHEGTDIHRLAMAEKVQHLPTTPGQGPDGSIQQDEPSSVQSGRARVWTARYALTAQNEEEARRYITDRALADVPDATVEFFRGPTRDRGPRSYWRATVRRTRNPEQEV